jgi:hypothetical protein
LTVANFLNPDQRRADDAANVQFENVTIGGKTIQPPDAATP